MLFVQAEDGIRDIGVTGVQTCALPILDRPPTVSPQRVTVTSEEKRSTVWTNLAEARACRPLRLTIGISRASAPSGIGAGGQSSGASGASADEEAPWSM